MRNAVALFVVVVLALGLAGCSGGDKTADADPVLTPPAASAAPAEEPIVDRSANDDDLAPLLFPAFEETMTPSAIQDRLDQGRPMVIFFYDSNQDVTRDTRAEVDAVADDYRGLVDLITYDVGATDRATRTASVMYASELGISSTPYVVVVDRGGFMTWRWKGYVERGILGREVERVSN